MTRTTPSRLLLGATVAGLVGLGGFGYANAQSSETDGADDVATADESSTTPSESGSSITASEL